jgi:hypothetical protein
MTTGWDAIAVDARDSVAVVLRDVGQGESIVVRVDGRNETIIARDPVALGHKIARRAASAGTPILKYGETIASATRDIAQGEHVHVHNVASNRAMKVT